MGCGQADDLDVSRATGVTLVELLVVLVILGVMAGVVGLTWRPGRWVGGPATRNEPILRVRLRAVESGRPTQAVVLLDGRSVPVIAYPDGRVLGAERVGVNPLTGGIDAKTPAR